MSTGAATWESERCVRKREPITNTTSSADSAIDSSFLPPFLSPHRKRTERHCGSKQRRGRPCVGARSCEILQPMQCKNRLRHAHDHLTHHSCNQRCWALLGPCNLSRFRRRIGMASEPQPGCPRTVSAPNGRASAGPKWPARRRHRFAAMTAAASSAPARRWAAIAASMNTSRWAPLPPRRDSSGKAWSSPRAASA